MGCRGGAGRGGELRTSGGLGVVSPGAGADMATAVRTHWPPLCACTPSCRNPLGDAGGAPSGTLRQPWRQALKATAVRPRWACHDCLAMLATLRQHHTVSLSGEGPTDSRCETPTDDLEYRYEGGQAAPRQRRAPRIRTAAARRESGASPRIRRRQGPQCACVCVCV